MRKINEKATKAAQAKQALGIQRLNEYFDYTPAKAPLNHFTGRVDPDRKVRRIWREWRDSTFPARVRRRKRRKMARVSRKANR